MAEASRPILRYFGGKWKLAPWILEHFPPHKVYTEVFGGSASVMLQKPPVSVEVYNDLNGEVVHVFRVLRDPEMWPELQRRMRCFPYARAEFDDRFEEPKDDIERALKTLAVSRMGFGANALQGKANSLRIRRDGRNAPSREWAALWGDVGVWADRFAGVTVECDDAIAVLKRYDGEEALHYVDPPYVHATRGANRGYRYEMSDEQHRSLAEVLHGLKGMVVLSGYDCDLYRELFGAWERVERPHGQADGANERVESLWLSPAASKALHPSLFGAA